MMPKFRVWDTVKKAMSEVQAIVDTEERVYPIYSKTIRRYIPFSEAVLMQSTGLFDVNGKEIFEGDVVVVYDELNEFEPEVYEIVYSQDNLAWIFYDNESYDVYLISTCTWDELEIIGNAHQNPELLEVNND